MNEDRRSAHDNSWLGRTAVVLYTSDHRKGESNISLLLEACLLPGVNEFVIGMFGETRSMLENVGSVLPSHVPLPSFMPFLTQSIAVWKVLTGRRSWGLTHWNNYTLANSTAMFIFVGLTERFAVEISSCIYVTLSQEQVKATISFGGVNMYT